MRKFRFGPRSSIASFSPYWSPLLSPACRYQSSSAASVLSIDEAREAYRTLGCDFGIDFKEVRNKYRKLAKENHPDIGNPDEKEKEKKHKLMTSINEAYSKLDQHFKAGGKPPTKPANNTSSSYSAGYGGMPGGSGNPYYSSPGVGKEEQRFTGYWTPEQGESPFYYMDPEDLHRYGPGAFSSDPTSAFWSQAGGGYHRAHSSTMKDDDYEEFLRSMNSHGFSDDYATYSGNSFDSDHHFSRNGNKQRHWRDEGPAATGRARPVSRNAGREYKERQEREKKAYYEQQGGGGPQRKKKGNANARDTSKNSSKSQKQQSSSSKFKEWSGNEQEALAKMYHEGKSFDFIANALGKSREDVMDQYNQFLHQSTTAEQQHFNRKRGTSPRNQRDAWGEDAYFGEDGFGIPHDAPIYDFSDGADMNPDEFYHRMMMDEAQGGPEVFFDRNGSVYMHGRGGRGGGGGRSGFMDPDMAYYEATGGGVGGQWGHHFDGLDNDGNWEDFLDDDDDDERVIYHQEGSHSMHGGRYRHNPAGRGGGNGRGRGRGRGRR